MRSPVPPPRIMMILDRAGVCSGARGGRRRQRVAGGRCDGQRDIDRLAPGATTILHSNSRDSKELSAGTCIPGCVRRRLWETRGDASLGDDTRAGRYPGRARCAGWALRRHIPCGQRRGQGCHSRLRRLLGAALRVGTESEHWGLLCLFRGCPWRHSNVLGDVYQRLLLRRLAAAAAARAGRVCVQRRLVFLQPVRLQSQHSLAVRRGRGWLRVCWHALLLVRRGMSSCHRLPLPLWIWAQAIAK